jgi:riboflavin synthase
MFTGIVEQTGTVKRIISKGDTFRLEITPRRDYWKLDKGASLSINGVCLTLVDEKDGSWSFDVMRETYLKTSFGTLARGAVVNIERSLGRDSRIEGHFVLGHVDTAAKILSMRTTIRPFIDVSCAPEDTSYIVERGSIALDGISLTVGERRRMSFRVFIIPYTLEQTNLKYKRPGDRVNVEYDILGKYIVDRKENRTGKAPAVTERLLSDNGFM